MERPPKSSENDATVISLMTELQNTDDFKKIQNDYLYWDKLKYKTKVEDKQELWRAIKLHRKINSKSVYFGHYSFSYPNTEFLQKTLHLFDLNIGGTLSSNVGITETNKSKFLLSSIMEEAISSSQMEGANTTRKKSKGNDSIGETSTYETRTNDHEQFRNNESHRSKQIG